MGLGVIAEVPGIFPKCQSNIWSFQSFESNVAPGEGTMARWMDILIGSSALRVETNTAGHMDGGTP